MPLSLDRIILPIYHSTGMSLRSLLILGATAILLFSLTGCSNENGHLEMPGVLKIGILPDESETILLKRYTPLFKYLSEELGVPYELKISKSYDTLLEQFNNKEIDLAYFGGYTFLQAYHNSRAVPLVMRDIDIYFTSYFIAKANTAESNIKDFSGKTFSFGSRLSTSGHLMPRYYLKNMNINPETYFSNIRYSGSHDTTAYWVKDGITDIGVTNSAILDKMFQDGRLKKHEIKIIWETPPYPDYVWALQSGYSTTVQTKIREAFLSLSPSNKAHAAILAHVDAGGFLPASIDDFSKLNDIALQSGLLDGTHK